MNANYSSESFQKRNSQDWFFIHHAKSWLLLPDEKAKLFLKVNELLHCLLICNTQQKKKVSKIV